MSDSALSQDEIDALLAGGDPSAASGGAGGGQAAASGAIQKFLTETAASESAALSSMTGVSAALKGPQVTASSREGLLAQLPDTVTVIKADYSSGFPGEHLFILSEEAAKDIASLMNKEDGINLDEMSMSVLGEVVSQIVSAQTTALTEKTGNTSIVFTPPQAANVPKAAAALPGGEFTAALYQLDLGEGKSHQLWEVYGGQVASGIARALSGGAKPGAAMGGGLGAGGMPGFGGGSGAGMGGMGGLGGMGGMGGGGASVQSLQFPNLVPRQFPQEQGNIGLIMDVPMEMTVELGRTKKLIKEILGMGEGTIIELDKLAGEPVDILVNRKLIAKGEVVVIDENFGVRVTEIVSPIERMNGLG